MKRFTRLTCIAISLLIIACQNKQVHSDDINNSIAYEKVNDWPLYPADFTLGQPTGIGVDSNDHIFIFHRAGRLWTTPFPDTLISRNTILEVDSESGEIINSWGADHFIMPHGLTVDNKNNVWVTDVGLHQVFKFSHDGELLMTLGVAKIPGSDSLHFKLPTDVAVANDGSFYISDGYGNSRVVKFSAEGKFLLEWGTYGNQEGQFNIPHAIALDHEGNVYVADRQNNRVQQFNPDGVFIRYLNNSEDVEQIPSITLDHSDRLLAIDYDSRIKKDSTANGSTVFQFEPNGDEQFRFGANGTRERVTSWYHDIAVDHKGNIYVGDITGMKVLKFKLK